MRDLTIQISGVGIFGQPVPVPEDLITTLSLNQPHHVDASVHEALEPWLQAFTSKIDELQPEVVLARINSVSNLHANLADGLTAARYHQRQFLCRFKAIDTKNTSCRVQGSQQLQVVLNDLPLRCELEAFLVRTSGSLDALGQLLGLIVTGKQRKYGDLLNTLEKRGDIPAVLRSELKSIFSRHAQWIEAAKNYRHGIVHEAEFNAFRGPLLGSCGISPAAVVERDASHFVIHTWANLRQMMRSVADAMYDRRFDWRIP